MAPVSIPDPYKTLQVDPEAEDEVIEAAYRRLARKYHPDVAPGPEAQDRMVRINQAWEMLRDRAVSGRRSTGRGHASAARRRGSRPRRVAPRAGQARATRRHAARRRRHDPDNRSGRRRPRPARPAAPAGVAGSRA